MEPEYSVVKLGGRHAQTKWALTAISARFAPLQCLAFQRLCDFRLTAPVRGRTNSLGGVNVWTPLQRRGAKDQS
jgi:hypothetical protein